MKVRLFRIRLSKWWSRMLCTVSALLLPLFVSGQDVRRVAYGSPYPDNPKSWTDEDTSFFQQIFAMYGTPTPKRRWVLPEFGISDMEPVPLITVDGNIWEPDEEKKNSFNFQDDSMDRKKVAELLGIKARKIKKITILKDAAATAVWGARGANGVLEVTTSYHRRYKHEHKDSIGK